MSIPVSPVPTFKLIVAGSRYVGKTTFLKRIRTCEFTNEYHPSQGVDVDPINFNTNYGTYCFNAWDVSSNGSNYDSGYYQGGTCAIIMFALSMTNSIDGAVGYYNAIKRACGDIPILVIQHKSDQSPIFLGPEQQKKILNMFGGEVWYGFSSMNPYNLESPFIHLLKQVTKKRDLSLIRTPAIQPPSFTLDPKIEPKIEPKVEIKVEPKAEPKVETKVEPKVETKVEIKVEPKIELKVELKRELKVEPKVEPKTLRNQIRSFLYEPMERCTIIVENIPRIQADDIELCSRLITMLRDRFKVYGTEEVISILPSDRSVCIIKYDSEDRASNAVILQNEKLFDLYHVLSVSRLISASNTTSNIDC